MTSADTRSRVVVFLSVLVALLATVAALVGLLSVGGDAPDSVRSVHGEVVDLYGTGLYRYDSVFKGAANRGSDLVTLVLAVPLLLVATRMYVRGRLRGTLVLSGALAWPLYLYASMALGAAYNELFLVYVALFGASLFAFVLTVLSIDTEALGRRMDHAGPRRRLAALMLAGGIVTMGVWLAPLIAAMANREPPGLLGHSSTMVTDALDLAVITPATLVTTLLLHRGRASGYLVAFPLLVLMTFLLPMIVSQTVFQLRAGVSFMPAEIIGPIGGFVLLAVLALGLVAAVLRAAEEPTATGGVSAPPRGKGRGEQMTQVMVVRRPRGRGRAFRATAQKRSARGLQLNADDKPDLRPAAATEPFVGPSALSRRPRTAKNRFGS